MMTMTLVQLFTEHGMDLLFGSTALLALGAFAMALHKGPIHVQRIGELTLVGVMAWLVLAVVPMPRFEWTVTLDSGAPPISPELRRLEERRAAEAAREAAGAGLISLGTSRETAAPAAGREATSRRAPDAFLAGGDAARVDLADVEGAADRPRDDHAGDGPDSAAASVDGRSVRDAPPADGSRADRPAPADGAPRMRAASAEEEAAAVLLAPRGETAGRDARLASPSVDGATDTPSLAADVPATSAGTSADAPLAIASRVVPAVLAWTVLAGSTLAAVYLLLGVVRLRRILAATTPAPDWVVHLLAEDAGPGPLPRVVVSTERCGPFCVGAFRPTIVLPVALVARRSSALRHVLLHELGHARQGDGRGQLLVALALPVLWMHPLYWWIRRRVRFAAELVADDHAAGVVPRERYARELIGLAETGWPSVPSPVAAPTILRSPSEFSRRIEMLLTRTDRLSTRCSVLRRRVQGLAAGGLVVLAAAAFGAPPAQAQDAGEYERLMHEKHELMQRMKQMTAEMNQMQAALEQARVGQEQARADADARRLEAEVRAAEGTWRQTAHDGVLATLQGLFGEGDAAAREARVEAELAQARAQIAELRDRQAAEIAGVARERAAMADAQARLTDRIHTLQVQAENLRESLAAQGVEAETSVDYKRLLAELETVRNEEHTVHEAGRRLARTAEAMAEEEARLAREADRAAAATGRARAVLLEDLDPETLDALRELGYVEEAEVAAEALAQLEALGYVQQEAELFPEANDAFTRARGRSAREAEEARALAEEFAAQARRGSQSRAVDDLFAQVARQGGGQGGLFAGAHGADPFGGAGGVNVRTTTTSSFDEGLFELVNQSIELDGELQLARLEVEETFRLADDGLVSDTQVRQAHVQLEMVERRCELVRSLLVSELRATEAELQEAAEQLDRTGTGRSTLMRLEARLGILHDAVGSSGNTNKKSKDEAKLKSGAR